MLKVNTIPVKVANRLNILSMIGPVSVVATIFALVIKESPFYIDLSVTALVGVLLCWRMKSLGLGIASGVLASVLAYNFFLEGTPLTLWEAGLGASLELTFALTALASLELTDAFHQACKAASATALNEVEEWKVKIQEALVGQEEASLESEASKAKLLKLQDALKVKTEQAEMFERLLELARSDLTATAASKETLDRQYFEQKNLALSHEASVTDLNQFISLQAEEIRDTRGLVSKIENELIEAQKEVTAKNALLQKQALMVMDLEWKIEQSGEESRQLEHYKTLANEASAKLQELEHYKSMAGDSSGKVEALGQQLEELIDRLKHIQQENDKLKEELEEALKPEDEAVGDSKELSRVMGLYNQLRSQFAEKSSHLDEARKQLFHSQENLHALQKEIEEKYVYDQEQIVAAYEKHNTELNSEIKRLESEIVKLEDLIKAEKPPKTQVSVKVAPAPKVQAPVKGPVKVQVLPKPKAAKKPPSHDSNTSPR